MVEVVIPAAGLGTRMGTYTNDRPKCLLRINDRTILEHQLELFGKLDIDISSIHVVIGTKGDCWTQASYHEIKNIHKNVVLNFENTSRGPAYSLKLGLENTTTDSVLIIDSDIILTVPVLQALISGERSTIVSKPAKSRGEPGSKVVRDDENVVRNIGKQINPDEFPWYIYAGVCKVTGSELQSMRAYLSSEDITDDGVEDILRYVCQNGKLMNRVFDQGWVNANKPEDLEEAVSMVANTTTERSQR